MLTRQSIISGAYLDSFDTLPPQLRWSTERIEQSMADTLRAKPQHSAVWVFAYGSLIWNPMLEFAERRHATLIGWHRSFCVRIVAGRARPETPGRMLAVEPGGATQGLAFRLDDANATDELRMMWIREMVTGSYAPSWAPVTLDDGRTVMAIVFVADPSSPQYEAEISAHQIAPMVAVAHGPLGSNADYVCQLQAALHDIGAYDSYVHELADLLRCRAYPIPSDPNQFDSQGDSHERNS